MKKLDKFEEITGRMDEGYLELLHVLDDGYRIDPRDVYDFCKDFLVEELSSLEKKVRSEMIEEIEKKLDFYIDKYEYRGAITGQEAREQTMMMVHSIINSLKEDK